MARKRVPYNLGDWFIVPLEKERYAVGVIARANMRGNAFGFLYLLRNQSCPTIADTLDLRPEFATVSCRFGDLYLLDGTWPLLGSNGEWKPEEWRMPPFAQESILQPGVYFATEYDDRSFEAIRQWRITQAEAAELPEDGSHGAESLKNVLNRMAVEP